MTNKKPCLDTFIKEYVLTGCTNARQSAIKAGYSERTADQQGSRLLKNVKVRTAIEEHKKASLKLFVKSKDEKLKMLQDIANACMIADDEKGMVNAQAAISAIKEHNAMQGDNAPIETSNTLNVVQTDDEAW